MSMAGRNHCGQAALAWLTGQPLDEVDARCPPDTPFRLAGTTPWGLARHASTLGLQAKLRWGRPHDLAPTLDAGGAVLLLVNLRPLGHPRFAMHWCVAHAREGDEVRLALAPRERVDAATLHAAWRGAPVPGYRYGAIHVSSSQP